MKTQRELNLEYWGRVHDMCTAYNEKHGTDVKPWECVKLDLDGKNLSCFDNHPVFNAYDKGKYTFAVAILEGKPVFVGDGIYDRRCGTKVIVTGFDEDAFLIEYEDFMNYEHSTLNPPAPKRTFMFNGVELPCPVQEPYKPYTERHFSRLQFEFSTAEEGKEFMTKLMDMIDKARDS